MRAIFYHIILFLTTTTKGTILSCFGKMASELEKAGLQTTIRVTVLGGAWFVLTGRARRTDDVDAYVPPSIAEAGGGFFGQLSN